MKSYLRNLSALVAIMFTTSVAFAGFTAYSGSTLLGNVTTLKCSTGLTCTKNGAVITAVSSPSLTGTTLNLSSTLNAAGDFSVATNKFNVTAASGNTAIAGTANVVGDFSVATNKFNVTAASGNTAVAGTLGVTGATTLTGGLAVSTPIVNFMGWKPSTLTSGTSTVPSATHVYVTQIFIPVNATLTGVYLNNGATVGTNKWIVALFNSAGAVVANSSLSGITTSGADGYQQLPFTGTYAAKTGMYWIGIYMNGTTDRFRSAPAVGQYAGYTGDITGQTFGTVATITPPTSFTADVGPVAFTY